MTDDHADIRTADYPDSNVRSKPMTATCSRALSPDARAAMLALAAAAALALSQGCTRAPQAASPLPTRLADSGLYADFATRTLAPDVLTYTPQYPAWCDGAKTRHWIALPAGSTIDATDPDVWQFPAGTRLWQQVGVGDQVETRFMQRDSDGGWQYATYVLTEDGDAVLAAERGSQRARMGTAECRACHESNPARVLGFSALQLSSDRDPLALHSEPPTDGSVDLRQLVERGLLRGLPAALVATPPRISASSARERAVLGYLHANCGACHNRSGPLACLHFDLTYGLQGPRMLASRATSVMPTLRHAPAAVEADDNIAGGFSWRRAEAHQPLGAAAAGGDGLTLESAAPPPAIATALDSASGFAIPGVDRTYRLAAGAPERSAIAHRAASRTPAVQMPPFGSAAVDHAAVAMLEAWIREDLAASPRPRASATDSTEQPSR